MNVTKPAFKIGVALALGAAIALPASADEAYYETAQVLSVTPQYDRVNNPRQDCRTEYQPSQSYNNSDHSYGGAIIGGVAGGLLGGQVGKGKGRVISSAIGAATGALVGDHLDNNQYQSYSTRPIERCSSSDNWQTVSRGYLVTYRYNGRDLTTVMPYDPGNSIRVRIAVTPDNGGNVSYLEPRSHRDDDDHDRWERRRDDWRR